MRIWNACYGGEAYKVGIEDANQAGLACMKVLVNVSEYQTWRVWHVTCCGSR